MTRLPMFFMLAVSFVLCLSCKSVQDQSAVKDHAFDITPLGGKADPNFVPEYCIINMQMKEPVQQICLGRMLIWPVIAVTKLDEVMVYYQIISEARDGDFYVPTIIDIDDASKAKRTVRFKVKDWKFMVPESISGLGLDGPMAKYSIFPKKGVYKEASGKLQCTLSVYELTTFDLRSGYSLDYDGADCQKLAGNADLSLHYCPHDEMSCAVTFLYGNKVLSETLQYIKKPTSFTLTSPAGTYQWELFKSFDDK